MIRQLLVLLLCLCTSVTFSQNLLQNGDFEVWTDPDEFPDGWGTVKSSSSVLWYAQAPEAYSGNHALWLIQPSTNNDHHRRFSSPLIEVEPGEYTFELRLKGKGKIRYINFTRGDEVPASGNNIRVVADFIGQDLDNPEWTIYHAKLVFPHFCADWPGVRMHISFNSTAEVTDMENGFYMDDVSIYKIEKTSPLVPVVFYLRNLPMQAKDPSMDVDEVIIADLEEDGFFVVELDCGNYPASSPEFEETMVLFHRNTSAYLQGIVPSDMNIDYNTIMYVPEGYRVARDVPIWNIRNHGAENVLERVRETYNDYVVKNKGMVRADSIGGMIGPYGEPIDYNLYIDIIYPTGNKQVPLLLNFSSNTPRFRPFSPSGRTEAVYRTMFPIGFLTSGYAFANLDHCYNPLARHEFYGYFDQYSLESFNGVAYVTSSIRYLRSMSNYYNLNGRIGVMGLSKASYSAVVSANINNNVLPEWSSNFGSVASPQPYSGYASTVDVAYAAAGNGTRRIVNLVDEETVPMITSVGKSDEYGHWEVYPEVVNALSKVDNVKLDLWMEELGHTYPGLGKDNATGLDRYPLFKQFFDRFLKPEEHTLPEILYVLPRQDNSKVNTSGIFRILPPDEVLPSDMKDISPYDSITVRFLSPMDQGSVHEHIVIREIAPDSTVVLGHWTVSMKATCFKFVPDTSLKPDMDYEIVVSSEVKDQSGLHLPTASSYTFRCVDETILHDIPANGDFEVWTDPDEFPDGWGTVKSSSSVLWYAQAPEAYSGNHALWLIQPSTNNDHHRRFSSPLIEVEPGEYIIEFYSKGKGKIRWINFTRESEVPGSNNRVLATGSFFGQNLDNDGWVKYTSRLDFPDEYSDWPNVRMHISFNSTAESSDVDNGFFLDMVTVTKVEPPASMTGTFYIDDANGNDAHDGTSPETAWQSLEKVNNTVFGPGANILFKSGGIWFGQLSPQGSGDANSPIVIDQYGVGDKPIIDGDGLDGAGVLSLYNQSYWEINNLEITNEAPEAGDRRGVEIKAGNYGVSTHIHLKNLHIHHITGTVGNDLIAKLSSGIYIATVADDLVDTRFHDVLVEGCHIHDIDNQGIVTNNEVKHSDYPGEADWMRRRFTDVRIRNNTIHHISKNAIIARMMEGGVVEYNLCYETATKITGNTIFSRSSRGTVFQFNEGYLNRSPDYDGSLYDPDLNSPETVWQYSYSHDNAHGLVWFCTSAPDNDVIVRYNISQNDKGSIFCVNFDNHSAYIYNNVVYIPEHLSPTIINERRNADKSYYFYNNIIYNQSTTASYNWFNAKREFSNNIFYGEHPDGEPFDPFKITEDPLFIAPGTGGIGLNTVDGYKLQSNSPAMGKGRHVVDNGGRDYFGNVVSDTLKTDIGFHQLSAIPDDGSYVIHDRIMVMEDAFVRGGDSGDENYGEEEELLVKISPTNDSFSRKSFMKFGLSGFDTTDNIAGVQLVFHARVSDGAPFPIQVYETWNSWNEEDISWNTAPQFGDFVGDVHISGNTFSTYAIDVTSNFMEALAADKILSFGVYDDAQTNYLARIVSKEGGGMQPFLSVTRTENDSTDMDIYILIGQSNMAGRGDMDVLDGEVLENVYLLNGDTWEAASNPLNRYSTVRKSLSMQQLGPGYTFGRKLAEYTGKRIGLVVNARGGSSIQSWQKGYVGAEDYDLYERAVSRARKAMRTGNLKGIIWHQGEANRSMGTAYLDQLGQLVEDLRGDLGADLVLVAGQIGQWRDNSENFNTVIDGIETEITNAFSVKSDGLTPLNGDLSDPHFDGISQRVLGGRYADMILEKVYGKEISPVTVYTECGFGGYSAKLDTGIYTLRKLEQMGILGNSVKGMEVQSNFEVRLHTGDGGEAYLSIMEDTGCLDGSSYDGNLDFVEVLFLEMDTIPPVIGAIHDISVESTIDECGVFLNLEEPEASDNRPGVGISGRRDDGLALDDVFPIGISQVIWTAIDAAGNTTEAIQQIEVLDKQNPLLELKEQISLWPPNGKTYSYTLDDFIASNTDNCGIPDAYIYKITSDEMVSESNFFIHQDCKGMSLIADRDDDGNGRVYQIHIRSEDTSGNVTEREFEVAVPISKNGIALAEEPVTVVESGCTGGVSTIPVNQTSYSSIIFPNPTQGDATLEIRKNKRAQLMEFKVHDGYHLVWEMSTTVPEGDSFHLLKTSGLKKGAYIVQVLSPEGVVTHKLIVRK